MKYESFYKQYDALQKRDIAELKRCLQHHGGKFSWNDNPDVEQPIIAVNTDFGCGDVRVGELFIGKSGAITCYGYWTYDGLEVEFDVTDVHYGHIEFISEYLPELNDEEKRLISIAATDLETGNHLLRERDKTLLDMMNELVDALNAEKPDSRQREIVEQYRLCTDYEYAQDKTIKFK